MLALANLASTIGNHPAILEELGATCAVCCQTFPTCYLSIMLAMRLRTCHQTNAIMFILFIVVSATCHIISL